MLCTITTLEIVGKISAITVFHNQVDMVGRLLKKKNNVNVLSLFWKNLLNEARHEISSNVVCATSKASDQPGHMRSLIRAFASRLNILWLLIATDWISFGVSKLKRRLHRIIWVYTCQNATLVEITCLGSNVDSPFCQISSCCTMVHF